MKNLNLLLAFVAFSTVAMAEEVKTTTTTPAATTPATETPKVSFLAKAKAFFAPKQVVAVIVPALVVPAPKVETPSLLSRMGTSVSNGWNTTKTTVSNTFFDYEGTFENSNPVEVNKGVAVYAKQPSHIKAGYNKSVTYAKENPWKTAGVTTLVVVAVAGSVYAYQQYKSNDTEVEKS